MGPVCSQKTQKRWNSSASHFLLGKVTTVYEHVVPVPARSCWCRNHCPLSCHLDQWVWTYNLTACLLRGWQIWWKKAGFQKNPRLQSLLAYVNRRNITFVHDSAKKGRHVVPDTLSRQKILCECQDCSVSKFLTEIPMQADLMSITSINNSVASISNMIWCDSNPGAEAATKPSVLNPLYGDVGATFGNKRVWKNLQSSDPDCRMVIELIISGNLPTKKTKRRIINKLLLDCSVNK